MNEVKTVIDWLTFSNMLPFMGFGLFVHIFGKFCLARKKVGYKFGIFVFKNWPAWALGLFYCLIGCYCFTRGIEVVPGNVPWDIAALFIGLSCGSLAKTTVKIFSKKEA